MSSYVRKVRPRTTQTRLKPMEVLSESVKKELTLNEFTRFYELWAPNEMSENKEESYVQKALRRYTHLEAVKFAAQTLEWTERPEGKPNILKPPGENALPTFPSASGIRAYYRVVSETPSKYILLACHVNVHGFHRGDLRFVQVNNRTVTRGFEQFNVIGSLFLGDVVAVTKLRRVNKKALEPVNVFKVHPDTECEWEVAEMTVLARKIKTNRTFAFLKNGTAVIKGHDEVVNAKKIKNKRREVDKLYSGSVFFPEKVLSCICSRYISKLTMALISKSSKIPKYPTALGTIFTYTDNPNDTKDFIIGVDAFKTENIDAKSSEKVVETCSLMGYSSANSVFNGRFDCRQFPMKDVKVHGNIVSFFIPNPSSHPTEKLWSNSTRIKIEWSGVFNKNGDSMLPKRINGVMETVILEGRQLRISARTARGSFNDVNFSKGIALVSQRESFETPSLTKNFFSNLANNSNGYRIIRTLYGGEPFPVPLVGRREFMFPSTPAVALNEYQNGYVTMLVEKTPMVLANAPFGCGKSMTIVTAAIEVFNAAPFAAKPMQLLVTQSNYASVNLVDIMRKCVPHFEGQEENRRLKFVRFVTESNWNELPDNCHTEFDLPVLMRKEFVKWAAQGQENLDNRTARTVVAYVVKEHMLQPDQLCLKAKGVYNKILPFIKEIPLWPGNLASAFVLLYRPHVVMTTVDSLGGFIGPLSYAPVSHVQVDEASQVPEYAIMSLLSKFPNACFGLIGDVHQLPPYCEEELDGKLKEYGVGNTMERAIEGKMFPRADLQMVYRCHPKTTEMLGELFYDGSLVPGVTAEQRDEFMRKTNGWPNPEFPITIINNSAAGHSMGTSCGNKTELAMVKKILENNKEVDGYMVKPEDIGVISFYAGQTALLIEAFRGTGIKCGTVDAFQGSEREVMVVCCTNEKPSEFMQLPNRLNVAMSRARQATVIIGNVEGLRKANYWKEIVKKVEKNGCLIFTTGKLVPDANAAAGDAKKRRRGGRGRGKKKTAAPVDGEKKDRPEEPRRSRRLKGKENVQEKDQDGVQKKEENGEVKPGARSRRRRHRKAAAKAECV